MSQTKVEAPFVSNNANFRNLFINGDMQIYQRGAASTPDSNGTFALDRWKLFNVSAGAFSVSQDTTVPTGEGFTKSVKWDCTTADSSLAAGDLLVIQQRLEGQMLQHLRKGTSNAKKTTVSFWVRSAKTGTHILELHDSDNTRQISKAYTIDSADTWEKKEIVFEGDTSGALDNDNAHSFQVNWWLAAGSTYAGGTLNTSWASRTNANRAVGQVNLADNTSNNFYLTGVQWEVGDQATDFEHIPFDVQLQRCRRYFQMFSNTSVDTAYDNEALFTGTLYTSSGLYGNFQLNPNMRTTPALYEVNGSAYYVAYTNNSNDTFDDLNINSNGSSAQTIEVYTGTGDGLSLGSGGQSAFVRTHNNATRLGVDAEL
jgi:hypothetical protein